MNVAKDFKLSENSAKYSEMQRPQKLGEEMVHFRARLYVGDGVDGVIWLRDLPKFYWNVDNFII